MKNNWVDAIALLESVHGSPQLKIYRDMLVEELRRRGTSLGFIKEPIYRYQWLVKRTGDIAPAQKVPYVTFGRLTKREVDAEAQRLGFEVLYPIKDTEVKIDTV